MKFSSRDLREILPPVKIYIKNMITARCKMAVKSELENIGVYDSTVELGEAEINGDLSTEQLDRLNIALKKTGLELIEDQKSILVEKIKAIIIDLVHFNDEQIKVNLSGYLSEKLDYNYTFMSNLFVEIKGTTIENFFLAHRIEKIKELLMYDELSLTQIALQLHYSSVAHLSSQFKKMTGFTPSQYKNLKVKRRESLESL